ncbi:hypothetical protein EVG20_g2233 [Dentipellis fragilis]|uniref:Casein kinase substrate phosphoprotein PP28 domain-containing protein n=1 Tax=Dentipellis fragilis TaxID=205917 RepID=A0A4Y9ZAE6_9AGAM|nr:hypothetical protein EVG20_g2233 [Dentipellis fragilis]
MARGAGKFKTKRGGGRSFSRHLTLDENGTAVSTDRRRRDREEEEDSDEESSEEEEDESEESEEGEEGGASGQPEMTRAERREMKKKQAAEKAKANGEEGGEGEDGDDILANPNRVIKKMNIADLNEPRQLSRKEREAKEKKEAQDRYWKLHVQGKTDQAKTDLARLAKIRAEREAAQAKRKAEAEAKSKEIEAKRTATRR